MSKDSLKNQIEVIHGRINNTISTVRRLLETPIIIGELIESLSEDIEKNRDIIDDLRATKKDLDKTLNDLINKLGELLDQYQKVINTLI